MSPASCGARDAATPVPSVATPAPGVGERRAGGSGGGAGLLPPAAGDGELRFEPGAGAPGALGGRAGSAGRGGYAGPGAVGLRTHATHGLRTGANGGTTTFMFCVSGLLRLFWVLFYLVLNLFLLYFL